MRIILLCTFVLGGMKGIVSEQLYFLKMIILTFVHQGLDWAAGTPKDSYQKSDKDLFAIRGFSTLFVKI